MRQSYLIIFLTLFCLSACAVKNNESTFDVAGVVNEQPAAPLNLDGPAEGLVRITVSLGQGSLKYAITDIGFQQYRASADGRVYIDINPGHHMVNACNSSGKFAVEKNTVIFPLYVNGTRLTRIRQDPEGGMFYLFIWPDGRVSADPP